MFFISARFGKKRFQSSVTLKSAKLMVSRLPTNFFSFNISILGIICRLV